MLKEKNNSFTPQKIDTTIQTFKIAIKQDTKNHDKQHLPKDNLTKKQREALMTLMQREELITTTADKGGATVNWGIEDYLTEANNQLNNTEF